MIETYGDQQARAERSAGQVDKNPALNVVIWAGQLVAIGNLGPIHKYLAPARLRGDQKRGVCGQALLRNARAKPDNPLRGAQAFAFYRPKLDLLPPAVILG